MNQWEVWFAEFPYEEDSTITKKRPVIVLDVETLKCLTIKVTSHDARNNDQYDTPIEHWQDAGLNRPSVARVSKVMYLQNDKFSYKLGKLHIEDQQEIEKKFMDFISHQ